MKRWLSVGGLFHALQSEPFLNGECSSATPRFEFQHGPHLMGCLRRNSCPGSLAMNAPRIDEVVMAVEIRPAAHVGHSTP